MYMIFLTKNIINYKSILYRVSSNQEGVKSLMILKNTQILLFYKNHHLYTINYLSHSIIIWLVPGIPSILVIVEQSISPVLSLNKPFFRSHCNYIHNLQYVTYNTISFSFIISYLCTMIFPIWTPFPTFNSIIQLTYKMSEFYWLIESF